MLIFSPPPPQTPLPPPRVVGHCRQCRELDNQARAREDFTLYRAMLRNIRKSEERFQDKSHIVFLLQEPDLRYLVENIWGGQSSLSAVRDVFELTLSRWEKKEHWSPWNCILLTKDEAKAHSKLEDIEQAGSCVYYIITGNFRGIHNSLLQIK